MKTTSKKTATVRAKAVSRRKRVRLEYLNPAAASVCVAGTFNDWHPAATDMVRMDDGRWVKELMLAPGRHEYRFVVDGVWLDDPACAESAPNPFGGRNSVLVVPAAG